MSAYVFVLALLAQIGQLQLPQPVGYVNDFAHVLSPDASARISAIIQDVKAKSGGEIVVVTMPDLSGRDPSDVALAIGRQWKVGHAGGAGDRARNTGVVILVVPRETSSDGHGHVQIATGQGSEGFLTDATTGAIQDEAIPFFRDRDYGRAITLITYRVAEHFASEFGFAVDSSIAVSVPTPEPGGRSSGGINPIFIFIIFIIVMSLLSRGRRGCGCLPLFIPMGGWGGGGGSGWGGGGGGGGFGGFGGFGGGGGFSGGGSGRSW